MVVDSTTSAFALFLESGDDMVDGHRKGRGERWLDWAIERFQGAPSLCHVEIACIPQDESLVHFATYIGQHASFRPSDEYYTHTTAGRWRAVPLLLNVTQIVEACTSCENAPYSMLRYLTALTPFRWIGRLLPNHPHSPAQCATLVARVLHLLDDTHLRSTPNVYAPVELYHELREHLNQPVVEPIGDDEPHVVALQRELQRAYREEAVRNDGAVRVRTAEQMLAAHILSGMSSPEAIP